MPQNSIIGVGGTYADPVAAFAAEEFADYGAPTRMYVDGQVASTGYLAPNTSGGRWPNGLELFALPGQEYDGTNHATCAALSYTSALMEFANVDAYIHGLALKVTGGYNNEVIKTSNTVTATQRRNIKLRQVYIESAPFYHGSTFAAEFNAASYASGLGSQYNLDFEDVVILARASNRGLYIAGRTDNGSFIGTVNRITVLPTNSGSSVTNALWIGGGNDSNLVVDSCLSLASEVRTNVVDYANDGMTGVFTNIATNDGTGTVTGVTTASELENYAAGDYRLKAGGTGYGAFPQAQSSEQIVESTFALTISKTLTLTTEFDHEQISESLLSVEKQIDLAFGSEYDNEQSVDASIALAVTKSLTFLSESVNESTEQIVESSFTVSVAKALAFVTEYDNEQVVESDFILTKNVSLDFKSDYENYTAIEQIHSTEFAVYQNRAVALLTSFSEEQTRGSAFTTSRQVSLDFKSSFINEISQWSTPQVIFDEPLPIAQMALTFDQLGRPFVFYKVGSLDLKLYWYDPVLGDNVTVSLTTGYDPVACFDFPQDPSQEYTDALLFYVRNDVVYMRRQRDRFLIEYDTGVNYPGVRLESAGFNTDDSVQVIYQFPEA